MDDAAESRKLAARLGVSFPLLRDADRKVATAYGAADADAEIAVPAVFVIDKAGRIRWRTIGETIMDRAGVEEILTELDKAR